MEGAQVHQGSCPTGCRARNVREHIFIVKEMYAHLQSESESYPGIGQIIFSHFCKDCGMIGKNFNISTADRLFISANYTDAPVEGNTAKDLIRYEFIEVLVRIAKVKYIDTCICSSYPEALETFFNSITPNFHPL